MYTCCIYWPPIYMDCTWFGEVCSCSLGKGRKKLVLPQTTYKSYKPYKPSRPSICNEYISITRRYD